MLGQQTLSQSLVSEQCDVLKNLHQFNQLTDCWKASFPSLQIEVITVTML